MPTPRDPPAASALQERLAVGVAALVLAGLIAVTAFGAVERDLIRITPDDAFYYFEIARRISLGQGSTFDGIQPTNGYHPLWCALLVPLGPVMDLSRDLGARLGVGASIACMGVALALVLRIGRRTAPEAAWVPLLVASCSVASASVYGLETALTLALLAAALARADAMVAVTRPAAGAGFGLLLGLIVLSRLDAVVYVWVLDALWLAAVVRGRSSLPALAAAVAVQGALVGGYLLFNEVTFGHPLTVSAMVKAGRGGGPNLRWLKSLLALLAVGSAGLGAAVLAARLDRSVAVRAAAAGATGHAALLGLRGSHETYNWTFAPVVLCGAILLGPAVVVAHRRIGAGTHAAVIAACLTLLAVAIRGKLAPSGFAEKIERAGWIAEHVPEGAVFAEGDCGLLGYLSGRPFVNVDGLTGSFGFQDAIRDDQLSEWFTAAGVNAVVLPAGEAGPVPLKVRPSRWGSQRSVDAEVTPWTPPVADAEYRLWRITGFVPAP
jgi:hypothetical protein